MTTDTIALSNEEIVDKYADMVYRLAVAQTGRRENADDVFQEVFLRLVRYRNRLENEEHLKAWLIRVTINCSHKYFNSFWNRNIRGMADGDTADIVDESASLEYEKIEQSDAPVTEAVHKLPEKYRIVIHLFYYEDFSILQICNILKQKESTVKSRLHRARELLHDSLRK